MVKYYFVRERLEDTPLVITAVDAQLDFLAWRDSQMIAISEQLEESFPELLGRLKVEVDKSSSWELARSTLALNSGIGEILTRWAADQLSDAFSRAEAELEQTILQLPDRVSIDGGTLDQVANALGDASHVGERGEGKTARVS